MLEHAPHADGEILFDEVVIIHSSGSTGELEVFEPYTRVRFPGVSGDVGGWSKALWEQCSLDVTTKGPWPHAWDACPRTPRWSGQGPYRLLSPPLDGRHHHAGHGVDC